MTRNIEHAILLYNEAARAEGQGNLERAEMLYMESRRIFEYEGGAHRLDAANIMNAVAIMKQRMEDYSGAIAAAQEAHKLLGPVRLTGVGGAEAEIRLRAWNLIGNTYRLLARHAEAEQILQKALAYACSVFGEGQSRSMKPASIGHSVQIYGQV